MPDEQRDMPIWMGGLVALGIAAAIAVIIGAIAGGFTGWSFGHWEQYILEARERTQEAQGPWKRLAWTRTAHFALPMALGGLLAYVLMERVARASGVVTMIPLAAGAAAGWLVGAGVLQITSPDAQLQATSFFLPCVLFVAIPMMKAIKESL